MRVGVVSCLAQHEVDGDQCCGEHSESHKGAPHHNVNDDQVLVMKARVSCYASLSGVQS